MAIVLPLAVGGRLTGSGTLVGVHGKTLLFATATHVLGEAAGVQVVIPAHGGDCTQPQAYPFAQIPAQDATVLATDPFADLSILGAVLEGATIPQLPKVVPSIAHVSVGTEIIVLGYPFAPLGSVLETWTPGYVTAKARRMIANNVSVDEIVLSNTGHPGSSGSAVVGRKDGLLYGILRGSLAPPEVMKIGNIPIATDTSVTFATAAHVIPGLLSDAVRVLEQ